MREANRPAAMKINNPTGTGITGAGQAPEMTQPVQGGHTRPAGSSLAASDQVQISRLSHYLNILRSDSPQHLAEVAQLTAAVSSGAYQVDPPVVSASIVRAHLAA